MPKFGRAGMGIITTQEIPHPVSHEVSMKHTLELARKTQNIVSGVFMHHYALL